LIQRCNGSFFGKRLLHFLELLNTELNLYTLKKYANSAHVVTLIVAAWLGAVSLPSVAGQLGSPFIVKVRLIPAKPPPGLPISAFCKKNNIPSGHGAVVTVVCATGAVVAIEPGHAGQPFTPMHGGAYLYVTHVNPNGELSDTVDAFSGAGTTTAWRVVKSMDRDYLEMTLGW
jgi:hypothetical protein